MLVPLLGMEMFNGILLTKLSVAPPMVSAYNSYTMHLPLIDLGEDFAITY